MRNKLIAKLYKEDLIPELLRESDDVASRRQNCGEMHELLKKALQIVNEVRDFKAFDAAAPLGTPPRAGALA
jgi:hypothetical protein